MPAILDARGPATLRVLILFCFNQKIISVVLPGQDKSNTKMGFLSSSAKSLVNKVPPSSRPIAIIKVPFLN